jgi:hypothetical protein
MASCHVLDIFEHFVAVLAIPNLMARVARVRKDRPDC